MRDSGRLRRRSHGHPLVGGREARVMLHPLGMAQQHHLAARLSSAGISHRRLCPHIPSSASLQSQQPSPWDCGTTLHSSSQPCAFQEICVPVRGMYGCGKDCLILLPFRLPRISSFTLSLKCFSSDSDSCPDVGIGSLLQFPHPQRAGPVLLTSSLVPSSYRVLRGSIYSFPLVRSSCPFSTGVLHTLLCLKVCS